MKYEELKREIENAPLTWLPALLVAAAEACCRRGVFVSGRASEIVRDIEHAHSKSSDAR